MTRYNARVRVCERLYPLLTRAPKKSHEFNFASHCPDVEPACLMDLPKIRLGKVIGRKQMTASLIGRFSQARVTVTGHSSFAWVTLLFAV